MCVAEHPTDEEIRAFYRATQFNKYLHCILQFLYHDMATPTTLYENNQAIIDIMVAGHITSRVKTMAMSFSITIILGRNQKWKCKRREVSD